MFEELDTVELTHDIKKRGLKKGDLGAIVNVYNDGEAYEVEFVAPNGRTKALLTLMLDDIRSATNRTEHVPYSLDITNTLGEIFTVGIVETGLGLKIETHKTKEGKKEFHYHSATL